MSPHGLRSDASAIDVWRKRGADKRGLPKKKPMGEEGIRHSRSINCEERHPVMGEQQLQIANYAR